VKSIMALHDEEADKAWVERWTFGGDWRVGLVKGLSGDTASGLGEHVSSDCFDGTDDSNLPLYICTSTS